MHKPIKRKNRVRPHSRRAKATTCDCPGNLLRSFQEHLDSVHGELTAKEKEVAQRCFVAGMRAIMWDGIGMVLNEAAVWEHRQQDDMKEFYQHCMSELEEGLSDERKQND